MSIQTGTIEKHLNAAGAVLISGKNHYKYKLPSGALFVTSKTPSDFRAEQKQIHSLRRLLGITPTVARVGERRPRKKSHASTLNECTRIAAPDPPADPQSPPVRSYTPSAIGHVYSASSIMGGRVPLVIPRKSYTRVRHGAVVSLSPVSQRALRAMAVLGEDTTPYLRMSVAQLNTILEELTPVLTRKMLDKVIQDLGVAMEEELGAVPEVRKLRTDMEKEFLKRRAALPSVKKRLALYAKRIDALGVVKDLNFDWDKMAMPAKSTPTPTAVPTKTTRDAGARVAKWIEDLPEGEIVTIRTGMAAKALSGISRATIHAGLMKSPHVTRGKRPDKNGSPEPTRYTRITNIHQEASA